MSVQKKITDFTLNLNTKRPTPLKTSPTTPPTVYSPVTELSFNLNDLSTSAYDDTPKRKPSLGDGKLPLPIRPVSLTHQLSIDDGCYVNSPSPLDEKLPTNTAFQPTSFQPCFGSSSIFETACKDESRLSLERASSAFKRFTSMPRTMCYGANSPADSTRRLTRDEVHPVPIAPDSPGKDEEGSQDSGIGHDSNSNKADDFEFAQPIAPAPRRVARVLTDETNSPRHSPVSSFKLSRRVSAPVDSPQFMCGISALQFDESPVKIAKTLSLDDDDGFAELDDEENIARSSGAPKGLDRLLHAPMFEDSPCSQLQKSLGMRKPMFGRARMTYMIEDQENSPVLPVSRRGLFRSPSAPRLFTEKSKSFCGGSLPLNNTPISQKRCEREGDHTPTLVKRRKSVAVSPDESIKVDTPSRGLQRCVSESEMLIKTALSRGDEQPDLIGDFSKPYALPLCKGKHQDMKAISPDTVADLLNGEYSHLVEKHMIIDCRYPYEFNGGHIRGARNIFTCDEIEKEFLKNTTHFQAPSDPTKRNILIFHCEFSSERGPKMSRFLRKNDRSMNKDCYPALHYPEVYLLEGGYKAFFESHQDLCDPDTYLPMLHCDHGDDLKHFRAKSKSWAGGDRGSRQSRRSTLKF